MTGQRCEIDSAGRVTGPISIRYNAPWPCSNGTPDGFVYPALGVVLHTEDGYEAGTITWFNNPQAEASAFFSVSLEGVVHQYGPVTESADWMAWAQADGNPRWRSIEHEDQTNPSQPFTGAQMDATAHLIEVLSRFDGFPLQAATDPFTQRGVTLHSEGGEAFGGHLQCPGTVRSAQRAEIITRAQAIRAATAPLPAPATIPGDPVLLNKGAGAVTPVAIPDIASSLRFLAADTAQLSVQFHGSVTQPLPLSWAGGSHSLTPPKDVYAALVTRVDAGTGDVCVVAQ